MKHILYILAFSFLLQATPIRSEAVIYPFGGPIIWAYPCVCTGSYLLYVGTPNPGAFLYTPASLLFLNYMIFKPGTWVLGTAFTAPAACLNPVCFGACCPTGFGMPIEMVGTSL